MLLASGFRRRRRRRRRHRRRSPARWAANLRKAARRSSRARQVGADAALVPALLLALLAPLLLLALASAGVRGAALGGGGGGANQTAAMMINCVQSADSDTANARDGRPLGRSIRHSAGEEPPPPPPPPPLSKKQQIQEEAFQRRLMELKQKYMTNRAISDRAYHILLPIYSLLILLGTVSNSLICLTVILKPQILSPRNIFIVNLAGSDLLLCVFTMPFSFVEISMKMWQLGLVPCKLVAGLQATSIFVSTISITAIALDRYKVIVYPTHQEPAAGNMRGALLLLASVWLGALLLSLPLFRFRTVQHLDLPHKYDTIKSIDFCVEAWPFAHGRGIYSVISMMFQYVLPITIVSVVYAKISDKLQKRLIRRQRLTQLECQQKRQLNLIRRTHTMLISVSLIFGLSWLPLNLLNLIGDFTDLFRADDQLFRVVFAVCHLIGCSSACSNPILYGYLNENFRKEFHQVYTHHMRRWARRLARAANHLPCCATGRYLPATPSSSSSSVAAGESWASSESASSAPALEEAPGAQPVRPPADPSAGSRLGTTMRLCWCTSGSSSTETLGGGGGGGRRRSSRLASATELAGRQRRPRCECRCHKRPARPRRLMSLAAEQELRLEESGGLLELLRGRRRAPSASSAVAPEQRAGRRVWLRCWPSGGKAQLTAEALKLGQVRQLADKERPSNGPLGSGSGGRRRRRTSRHCPECREAAKARRAASSASRTPAERKIQGLQVEPSPSGAAAAADGQPAAPRPLKATASEQQIACYLSVETARRRHSAELSKERSTSLLILEEPPAAAVDSAAGQQQAVIGLASSSLPTDCCKRRSSSASSSSSSAASSASSSSSSGCLLSGQHASLGSCTCSLTTTPTTATSSACQLVGRDCGPGRPASPTASCPAASSASRLLCSASLQAASSSAASSLAAWSAAQSSASLEALAWAGRRKPAAQKRASCSQVAARAACRRCKSDRPRRQARRPRPADAKGPARARRRATLAAGGSADTPLRGESPERAPAELAFVKQ